MTGASGFIGRAITRILLDAGYGVHAIVRPESQHSEWLDGRAHLCRLHLHDVQGLVTALAECEALVYCAGSVRGTSTADFVAANVAGVQSAIEAIASCDHAVDLLLISSLAASQPNLSHYAASKRHGENLARGAPNRWCVLRPPAVYGPGDTEMRPLFHCIRRGVLPTFGSANARFSLLYVDDLARGVEAWLRNRATCQQQVFGLDDGHPGGYAWQELADAINPHGTVRLPIPRGVLRISAAANEFAARVFSYSPMLTRGKVRELCHPDWVCDNADFSAATGWCPRVGLADGSARMFSSEGG